MLQYLFPYSLRQILAWVPVVCDAIKPGQREV